MSIALLTLGACASTAPQSAAALRPLVSPASLGSDRVVNQVVRGAFGARELTFNCVVNVKDGVMTLVGLNSLGVRLFTVRYDGKPCNPRRRPRCRDRSCPSACSRICSSSIGRWPASAKPMAAAGWQLSEPSAGVRRLRRGEQLIAEAHYSSDDPWSGRSWLVNFEFGYSLQIDSQAL